MKVLQKGLVSIKMQCFYRVDFPIRKGHKSTRLNLKMNEEMFALVFLCLCVPIHLVRYLIKAFKQCEIQY